MHIILISIEAEEARCCKQIQTTYQDLLDLAQGCCLALQIKHFLPQDLTQALSDKILNE